MQPKSVNFGTLLESVEDWIRNGQSENRIMAKIVDASKTIEAIIDGAYFVENDNRIYLVIRRREQEDLYDDAGNLLNDESPSGIYKDLQELEESGVNYSTPIEIEIWFSDGEDELQYRLECHQYYFSKNNLWVVHYLGREENGYEQEFRKLLHEQYYP